MKKYNFIFKISFISYLLALVAMPYMTARIWADIILFIFIFFCIYQINYIFYFRKEENVTFLEGIANYFLYLTYTCDVVVGYMLLDAVLEIGYTNGWEWIGLVFVGLPTFVVCSIYQFIYYRLKKRKKDIKENIDD